MIQQSKLTKDEFLAIKHKIDDEVARLGWSKRFCKKYIEIHYGRSSRLAMTDEQLTRLLASLQKIPTPNSFLTQLSRARKRKARRRI